MRTMSVSANCRPRITRTLHCLEELLEGGLIWSVRRRFPQDSAAGAGGGPVDVVCGTKNRRAPHIGRNRSRATSTWRILTPHRKPAERFPCGRALDQPHPPPQRPYFR